MEHYFFFTVILDRDIDTSDIENLIKDEIINQSKSAGGSIKLRDEIDILKYAYVKAEPYNYIASGNYYWTGIS